MEITYNLYNREKVDFNIMLKEWKHNLKTGRKYFQTLYPIKNLSKLNTKKKAIQL